MFLEISGEYIHNPTIWDWFLFIADQKSRLSSDKNQDIIQIWKLYINTNKIWWKFWYDEKRHDVQEYHNLGYWIR